MAKRDVTLQCGRYYRGASVLVTYYGIPEFFSAMKVSHKRYYSNSKAASVV
jgi:hypothetical protein